MLSALFRLLRLDTLTVFLSCGLALPASTVFVFVALHGTSASSGTGPTAGAPSQPPPGPQVGGPRHKPGTKGFSPIEPGSPDDRLVSGNVRERRTAGGEVIVEDVKTFASGRREIRELMRWKSKRPSRPVLGRQDAWGVGLFAFPVLLAALPLAFNRTRLRAPARIVAAVMLLTGVLATGLTIGLFYLPSAMAMVAAAAFSLSGQ